MPTVRPFQAHEWSLYRELRLEALRESPDAFGSMHVYELVRAEQEWIDRLAAGVASQLDQPLVAEDSGRAVGLAWVRIDAKDASTAMLYQVWIDPNFRGRGAGRELLAAAINWARGAGAATMILDVACGPTSALGFYRSAGFVEYGERTPLRPGSDVLRQPMRLKLR